MISLCVGTIMLLIGYNIFGVIGTLLILICYSATIFALAPF